LPSLLIGLKFMPSGLQCNIRQASCPALCLPLWWRWLQLFSAKRLPFTLACFVLKEMQYRI